MAVYAVSGKTGATAATIDHALAAVWNASSIRRIRIQELHVVKQTAGAADEPTLRRISARGTPGSTITPTIVNDLERDVAPVSGFVLDMAAYSVQPTLEAVALHSYVLTANIGAGVIWTFPDGLWVPAGAGIAITAGVALAFPVSRVTAVVADP